MSKLDQTLFTYSAHALSHESCPQCHGELQLRHGKHGVFLGCNQYPTCDYIRPLHQRDGHIVKHLGIPCPECEHELVLRQGRYGMFIGCSHYPTCHHIESLSQPEDDISSETETILCPECKHGHLVERKSRHGKIFWACNAYPKCRFALNHPPKTGQCSQCHFPLLIEKNTAQGVVLICADKKCSAPVSDAQFAENKA